MTIPKGKDAVARLQAFVIARRKNLKLSQQRVAQRSGVSMGWIGTLESGRLKNPPLRDTLLKLVKGIARPGEHEGSLYNFLQLHLAGAFAPELVEQVALGEVDTARALGDAAKGGVGVSEEPDLSFQIFYDRQDAQSDLDLVLGRVRPNVKACHYETLEVILRTLFEEGPDEPAPAVVKAQRERRALEDE